MQWRSVIARNARKTPGERFRNLPAVEFDRRLRTAARRYRFTIKSVRFYKPRQLAPLVVIESRHYLAIAQAILAIERSLDPHTGTDDRTGWAYEGFYLEAQDERGIPFVIVSNALRGDAEGSQFARSEELYPFAHF